MCAHTVRRKQFAAFSSRTCERLSDRPPEYILLGISMLTRVFDFRERAKQRAKLITARLWTQLTTRERRNYATGAFCGRRSAPSVALVTPGRSRRAIILGEDSTFVRSSDAKAQRNALAPVCTGHRKRGREKERERALELLKAQSSGHMCRSNDVKKTKDITRSLMTTSFLLETRNRHLFR